MSGISALSRWRRWILAAALLFAALSSAADSDRRAARAIGLIDSPSLLCVQPDARQDTCFVRFASIGVDAAPESFESLTVDIDGRRVAQIQGYFQQALALGRGLFGAHGLRLSCGPSGVDGDPDPAIGRVYPFELVATDSDGGQSTSTGSFRCPAHDAAEARAVVTVTPGSLAVTLEDETADERIMTLDNAAPYPMAFDAAVEAPGCGAAGPGWATVDPGSGELAALRGETLALALDTGGLAVGSYQASLCIQTTDTAVPIREVPVTLTVIDEILFADGFENR